MSTGYSVRLIATTGFALLSWLLVSALAPLPASAANALTILSPLTDQVLTGSTLLVQARGAGVTGVRYSIDGGPSGKLSLDTATGLWRATIDISGIPAGYRNVKVAGSVAGGQVNDVAWRVSFPSTARPAWGVNYSGAEFGSALPGTQGIDYIYPTGSGRNTYFASRGLRLIRLPIKWERLQHQAYGPLSQADLDGVRQVLDGAAAANMKVIIDLHNFGRYYGTPLTVADSPRLANFWQQLAAALRGHPALYGYELMNEPHDMPDGSAGWAAIAQSATNGVRQSDSAAWVVVPGYNWQTAAFWPGNNPTLDVHDSANHLEYAAHLYFDSDYSGQYAKPYDADGAYPGIGVDRAQPFLKWLAAHGARGIFTEYGVPGGDSRWLTVLNNFLNAIWNNATIMGGTYWSAGPWWGSYPLSVEPVNGKDRPQMAILSRYPSK
jgi:endoglucanase